MNKVIAVIVFIVLILLGTYFARVRQGGIGSVFLGYTFAAMAFSIAPIFWNKK